jgi:hypothetical protein
MTTREQVKAFRAQFERQVAEEIQRSPRKSYKQIGIEFDLSVARVSQLAVEYGVRRPRGRKRALKPGYCSICGTAPCAYPAQHRK